MKQLQYRLKQPTKTWNLQQLFLSQQGGKNGHSILSTPVISSRPIITKPYPDLYFDPYHGKPGRHALTSNKIYFSKKLGFAVLSGTRSDSPPDGKIQHIPVRIPPSPPQETLESQWFRGFVMPLAPYADPYGIF